ncbi:MAG TPA: hypothetical protein VK484_11865, partial [Ferruginibacter sp.]|nr:hypothetical protein [Ferruginibacter sp.]
MRKLLLFSVTVFLLFTFLTAESQTRKEKREARREARKEAKREKKEKREKGEGEEKDEYDNPEIRDKQAAELIKDPALGYVPYQRLLTAIDRTEDLKAAMRLRTNTNFNNLQSTPLTWIERGPIYDSVGPSNGNTRGGANTLGGHTSGRMRAILLDTLNDPTGNTVFAAGIAGGLWKTTNFLSVINNWTPIDDRFDNLAISSICQDPTNPQIIYFSTGEPTDNADRVIGAGVWKSVNGGASFTWLPVTANFMRCFKIACDAAGNVYLANRTTTVPVNQQIGLLRSTNGGNTWVDITPNDLDVPNTGTSCTDFEITGSGILNAMFGYRGVGNKVEHRYTLTPTSVTPGTWSTSTGFRTSNFAAIRTEMAVLGEVLYAVTINTAYNTDSCYKSVNG